MFIVRIYENENDILINEEGPFYTYNEAINYAEMEVDVETQ